MPTELGYLNSGCQHQVVEAALLVHACQSGQKGHQLSGRGSQKGRKACAVVGRYQTLPPRSTIQKTSCLLKCNGSSSTPRLQRARAARYPDGSTSRNSTTLKTLFPHLEPARPLNIYSRHRPIPSPEQKRNPARSYHPPKTAGASSSAHPCHSERKLITIQPTRSEATRSPHLEQSHQKTQDTDMKEPKHRIANQEANHTPIESLSSLSSSLPDFALNPTPATGQGTSAHRVSREDRLGRSELHADS